MPELPEIARKKRVFCAFCGGRPSAKNREHVLPQWLLKLTGDPNRTVYLGWDFKKRRARTFSYSSLTVPACASCNTRYSEIEARAKGVVESMLGMQPISRSEVLLLLDWIDKVRTGLWTLYYFLDDNLAGIDPLFAIDQRIGTKDRMLLITRSSDTVRDLTYRGCNTPSFYYTPSVFSLMVNDLALTSISYTHFLSEDLGLPYPVVKQMSPSDELVCFLAHGSETYRKPAIAASIGIPATRIYQPIWTEWLSSSSSIYSTDYVRSISLQHESGKGLPLLERGFDYAAFPEEPTSDWIPEVGPRNVVCRYLLSRAVLRLQTRIDELAPDFSLLDEASRRQFNEILMTNRSYNEQTVSDLEENWNKSIVRHIRLS